MAELVESRLALWPMPGCQEGSSFTDPLAIAESQYKVGLVTWLRPLRELNVPKMSNCLHEHSEGFEALLADSTLSMSNVISILQVVQSNFNVSLPA